MQSETLLIIREYFLTKKKIEYLFDKKLDIFIEFLKNKKINNYIMPMEIVYLLDIEILDGYLLMSHLEHLSIVKTNYQIICSNCKKLSYNYLEDLEEIENNICDFCMADYEFDKKNIILIYKVIVE